MPAVIQNVLRSRWLPGLLLALVVGPFYWLSAVTRVGGGDWGQFQTFGYMGGIAHPPGYPLIIGSINLATRIIRFADPAHVANIVNATYATAAAVVLFYTGWLLTRSRVAALVATIVFATGYSIWAQATQAGHISVQTLLVFVLILALVSYAERPTTARLAAVAFAAGLSLTNHGLSLFMLPATVIYVASRRFPDMIRPHTLLTVAGAGLLGLAPWLYVLRGLIVPVPMNRPESISRLNVSELIHLVVGKPLEVVNDSGAVAAALDGERPSFFDEWPKFAHDVLREYGWIWIAPALVGWLVLARRHPRLAGWIAWTGLTTLWFALATPPLLDTDRYFSVIYALLAVCLAVGIGWLFSGARHLTEEFTAARIRVATLAVGLIIVIAAGVRLHQQLTGPARINVVRLRENAEEQAEIGLGIVRHMAPGGVYLTNWTSAWYPRYARHVLGVDRDLSIQIADFGTMNFEQAESILATGRRLYLQRTTPQYEAAYTIVQRAGVFYEVLPKA